MASSLPATHLALLHPDIQVPTLLLSTVPLPVPTPNTDEHLIRVHAAAITNGELLWPRENPLLASDSRDSTPIYDIAGTVIISPASSPFQPGAEIYALTSFARTGSGRQYTIAVTSELALKPRSLSWAESATVPMSAQTAWQALFVQAGLKAEAKTGAKGKKIYVTAASGGVGSWVVQLAKWAGAEVFASCGTDNLERVRSLGANEVVDYHSTNVKEWAANPSKKADVVIDCIGLAALKNAWYVVKPGGTLISIVQPPEQIKPEDVNPEGIRNLFFIVEPSGAQSKTVTDMWEDAGFVPTLDSVFPLARFEEAFAKVQAGKTKGKVVLTLD